MLGTLLIVLALIIFILVGWHVWSPRISPQRPRHEVGIPEGLSLQSQPLLTKAQAAFYNILRLAVEEQYLVFAQVPLWSLVHIRAKDPKDSPVATSFLNKISKQRVDFVLVHPGTLAVAKVVELDDPAQSRGHRSTRDRWVRVIFQTAGIEWVKLNAEQAFTVPSLANLLEVQPRD